MRKREEEDRIGLDGWMGRDQEKDSSKGRRKETVSVRKRENRIEDGER